MELHNNFFNLFSNDNGIFKTKENKAKVVEVPRRIWEGLEKFPPELIPKINWWLVEPHHPRPEDLPLSKRHTTNHLLITLEFDDELGHARAEFRIYADGEIESKNFFEDDQGYSHNPPMFNLLDEDALVREKEWKHFNNYLIQSLDLRIAYRKD